MDKRAGRLVKNLHGEAEYKSFCPTPLRDVTIEIDDEILNLLVNANKQLATLDNLVTQIPSLRLFVSMYVRKEALMSSQIEGTQTTLEDVLDPNIQKNTNRDVIDVVNYVKATEYSIERLNTLPLCNRLIKEAHCLLMENVRGQEKSPGEFRTSQNWIGGQGSTLKNARFVPPNVVDMQESISDLEKYINSDSNLDNLIRAGLVHYQFETIHPFLDGNGRVGRLLITLFLIDKKVLSSPALYISYFLKKNRIEYYDRMMEVRTKGNYEQWIKFFLRAVIESAEDANCTILKLKEIHDKNIALICKSINRPNNALRLLEYLEQSPIIDVAKTATKINLAFNTVHNTIIKLIDLGILEAIDNANRNRRFQYTEYLNILRDGTN